MKVFPCLALISLFSVLVAVAIVERGLAHTALHGAHCAKCTTKVSAGYPDTEQLRGGST